MATPYRPALERAFRLVAGDLPPTSDIPFDDPTAHEPGHIDKRVLLQSTWWFDVHANRHRLDRDMSDDYRANVLGFLDRESPQWVHEAMVWVVLDAMHNDIPATEASVRLELLDLLTAGWTGHTQLGRRLHQLNGTSPEPLDQPPVLLSPAETEAPQIVRDHDHGAWRVTTASTTTYLIDLDRRLVARHPETGAGNGASPSRPGVPVRVLPFDGEWTDLVGLVQCRLGRPLVILDDRRFGPGYRISTPVTGIETVSRP